MAVYNGEQQGGVAAPYHVSDQPVAGGNGRTQSTNLFATVGGVPMELSLSAGIYLPSQIVFSDTNNVPVKAGDATNNSIRTTSVGGTVSISPSAFDNSAFSPGVNGGIPNLYATGTPTPVAAGVKFGVPRMGKDRVAFTTGPPRENIVQGFVGFAGTSELTVLPAGEADVFLDLTGIWIYSTNATTRFTIFLRDDTGGGIRFPVAIAAGGGQVNPLSRPWLQTSPAKPWTAQLDVSPAPGLVYVILQAEKRTANS